MTTMPMHCPGISMPDAGKPFQFSPLDSDELLDAKVFINDAELRAALEDMDMSKSMAYINAFQSLGGGAEEPFFMPHPGDCAVVYVCHNGTVTVTYGRVKGQVFEEFLPAIPPSIFVDSTFEGIDKGYAALEDYGIETGARDYYRKLLVMYTDEVPNTEAAPVVVYDVEMVRWLLMRMAQSSWVFVVRDVKEFRATSTLGMFINELIARMDRTNSHPSKKAPVWSLSFLPQ